MSSSYHASDPYYSPPPQYHPGPSSSNVEESVQGSPPSPQRKRPKYTRSKTGCMTCRAKKIKCDETKPVCMRCTHGSRECLWPESVPVRKKTAGNLRSDSTNDIGEANPPMPESPTSSTRSDDSLTRRSLVDFGLMPPLTSRSNDTLTDMYSSSLSRDLMHSSLSPNERTTVYPPHSSHLPLTPENHFSTMRYDQMFVHDPQLARGIPATQPVYSHQGTYWNADAVDPYYHEHSPYQVRPTGPNDYPPSQDRFHG